VGLLLLGAVAAAAWETLDPGRIRYLVLILLGGFALRVLLMPVRSGDDAGSDSRYDEEGREEKS
jgi:hypothetical protein